MIQSIILRVALVATLFALTACGTKRIAASDLNADSRINLEYKVEEGFSFDMVLKMNVITGDASGSMNMNMEIK